MNKKPCIQCGKDCDILPVQLGDIFTLVYLRICGGECMFLLAYEYLYEIGEHKSFRNTLYNKQNEEDKDRKDAFVDKITEESIKMMRESFETNPQLLSTPVPEEIAKMFGTLPKDLDFCSTVRFTRPKIEDKIKWQLQYVEKLENKLKEAMEDLEKLKNDHI